MNAARTSPNPGALALGDARKRSVGRQFPDHSQALDDSTTEENAIPQLAC